MRNKTVRTIEQVIIQRRDNSLIRSILSGDQKSVARLAGLYRKRVYALGMSFFRNEADTDDFVQEVFIKVFLNLASFKGDSSFATWLVKIAWTTAVNSANRRKEYLSLADEGTLEDCDYTPEEMQIRKMTAETVNEAVKELPENNGICLELYFFYDMSYEEISVITDFPMNTIKSYIFRAKKILREKLRGLYE
ncbi:MAG: sigma-70 family RNA polymerase sigma factor [Treponema sp.]|nr:sigma-70 family RNA polymerase sigma factor [Treponema sp.]